MKRLTFFYLSLFAILQIACNKLDVKPRQSLVVPSTTKDFQGLLDNTDLFNSTFPVLGEISAGDFSLSATNFNALTTTTKGAYSWSKTLFEGASTDVDWDYSYQRVFYSNIAMEGLNYNSSRIQKSDFNYIMGQALFHRALAFFSLMQEFAPPYSVQSSNRDQGIPLRLSSDLNIPSVRSSVEENYQQVIKDLLKAKDVLPVASLYKTRPSKPAAYGLLARVYLCKGDYSKALMFADSCLAIEHSLLDYNKISQSATFPFPQFNSEVIFHAALSNSGSINPSRAIIEQGLYNEYEATDLRKVLFFRSTSSNPTSFRGNYMGNSVPLFCGISYDEVYLIKAECSARLDKGDGGLTELNTLLKSRYRTGMFVPIISNNNDELLTRILLERRKQLLMRGLRWMDLRRLHADPRFAITLIRKVDDVTFTLSPSALSYTLPFPNYLPSSIR